MDYSIHYPGKHHYAALLHSRWVLICVELLSIRIVSHCVIALLSRKSFWWLNMWKGMLDLVTTLAFLQRLLHSTPPSLCFTSVSLLQFVWPSLTSLRCLCWSLDEICAGSYCLYLGCEFSKNSSSSPALCHRGVGSPPFLMRLSKVQSDTRLRPWGNAGCNHGGLGCLRTRWFDHWVWAWVLAWPLVGFAGPWRWGCLGLKLYNSSVAVSTVFSIFGSNVDVKKILKVDKHVQSLVSPDIQIWQKSGALM